VCAGSEQAKSLSLYRTAGVCVGNNAGVMWRKKLETGPSKSGQGGGGNLQFVVGCPQGKKRDNNRPRGWRASGKRPQKGGREGAGAMLKAKKLQRRGKALQKKTRRHVRVRERRAQNRRGNGKIGVERLKGKGCDLKFQ